MKGNRTSKFRGIGKLQFWSLGKLRLSNFSVLLSLLPLFVGGFFTVVTETKAEARHTEECCVVAQNVPQGYEEEVQFSDRFGDRTYEVFVPTYSEDLLYFVQSRVDGRAQLARRAGRPVITLGRYDLNGARRRVRQLMREGITAEIVANSRTSGVSFLPDQNSRYVVYVPVGRRVDIEDALFRIQSIAPEASVWQYRGRNVILVGQFDNQSEALEVRSELRTQGIRAQFVRNPIRPVVTPISSNETNFVALEKPNENRFAVLENQVKADNAYTSDNYYSVVIPVRQEELAAIAAQVREMAINSGIEDAVVIENESNRPQLIVGPFAQLEAAQEWESYLQEYGISNARVINSK
ncbi:MAG TPA: hypothetical protein VIQ31_11750 [Phormidium sp.]